MNGKIIKNDKESYYQNISNIEAKIKWFTRFAWGFIVLGFLSVIYIILWKFFVPSDKITFIEFGTFLSGAVCGSFSLAGFFFIYIAFLGQRIAIIQQKIELNSTRSEMRQSLSELRGQRQALERQNENLKFEKFESTFFKLLEHFNFLINSFIYNFNGKEYIGLFAIDKLSHDFFKAYEAVKIYNGQTLLSDYWLGAVKQFKQQCGTDLTQLFYQMKTTFIHLKSGETSLFKFLSSFKYNEYFKLNIPSKLKVIIVLLFIFEEDEICKELIVNNLILDKNLLLQQFGQQFLDMYEQKIFGSSVSEISDE